MRPLVDLVWVFVPASICYYSGVPFGSGRETMIRGGVICYDLGGRKRESMSCGL